MRRASLIVQRARTQDPSLLDDLKDPVNLLYRHFLAVDRDARAGASSAAASESGDVSRPLQT